VKKSHTPTHLKVKAAKLYEEGGYSFAELSKFYDVDASTVCHWVKEHRKGSSLERVNNPCAGRQPKIDGDKCKQLVGILKRAASDFDFETDFWTTKRVKHVVKRELKLKVSRMAVHRLLKRFEYSYRKPEARFYHRNKDKNTQEWRKKTVPAIKRTIKKYNAILYFEDESTISLLPSVAKTWGPKGKKITKIISPNRGSVSAISAISKSSHLLFNVHDKNKRFRSDDIIQFLSEMLQHHRRRHLVVIMDQAPCHTSKKVKRYVASQKRLHVFYLPPRSPEFNPDEQVWDYLKNKQLKEHKATSTKDLKKLAKKKLNKLAKDEKLIQGIFNGSEGASFFA